MIRSEAFQGQAEGVVMTEFFPESQDFGGSRMRNSTLSFFSRWNLSFSFVLSCHCVTSSRTSFPLYHCLSHNCPRLPLPYHSGWLSSSTSLPAVFAKSLNIYDPPRPDLIYTSKWSGTMKPFSDISTHTTASSSYSTSSNANNNNSTNNAQSCSSGSKVLKVTKKE
ncbi:hypothetical protein BDW67DRAFT_157748 [Aspergillus spinulosporus]